jgi:MFS family permease
MTGTPSSSTPSSRTTAAAGPRPGTARAALQFRDFRLIWIGLFLSNIGSWMQNLALPAYIDARTGSATIVSILVFAQLGPLLLLAIPGGVIADKVPRKPWLISMQSVQVVFSIVLAGFVAWDSAIWMIFLAQLGVGVANALNAPAFQASIPMLVPREHLAGAISLNSVMLNGSRVIGPAIAAVLAIWGVTTSQLFLVNAATYLFLIAALVVVAVPDVRGTHPERGWRRALTGLRIARERRVLSRLLLGMASFSFFCLVYVALFASVTRLNLGIDPEGSTFKWLYATWGLGAMVGALAVGSFLSQVPKEKLISVGFAGFAVSLAVFALLRSPEPAFPVGFVLGFFYFVAATAMITMFQQNMRDTERASVMPLWFMAFGGTVTLGGLAFGPVIDAVGARWVLLGGAVWAAFLVRWCDLRRLEPSDFLREESSGDTLEARNPTALDEQGLSAGE